MAHSATISTTENLRHLNLPGGITGTSSKDGKMFFTHSYHYVCRRDGDDEGEEGRLLSKFCRHHMVSGETDVFLCDIVPPRGRIVNFYSLSDEILVLIEHNRANTLWQHMVQLVPSEQTPTTVLSGAGVHQMAYAICTRTITLVGGEDEVHIGLGLIHSGWLLVTSAGSPPNIDPIQQHAHLIASNPLLVDRYPDRDLSREACKLAKLADEKNMRLHLPMITKDGVFYLLKGKSPEGDRYFDPRLATRAMGLLYFENGGTVRVELKKFNNLEVEGANSLQLSHLDLRVQAGAPGYMFIKHPDWETLETRRWTWKQKAESMKFDFFDKVLDLLEWVEPHDKLQLFMPLYDFFLKKRGTMSTHYEKPTNYFVYDAIDFVNCKFRRIPYERPDLPEFRKDPTHCDASFIGGSPNGKFFIVHLPRTDAMHGYEYQKTLHITLLWDPAQPPLLKEIAERAVMKLAPNYRTVEFRKQYGLLEKGGEKRKESESTVAMKNSSYSLLENECELSVELGTVASETPDPTMVLSKGIVQDTL